MAETEYGIRKSQVCLPTRNLLVVPHRGKELIVSHPVFAPNTFDGNVAEMQRTYTHSQDIPQITFREPTTSQSISAVTYHFKKMAKPQIFDSRWLQTGRIVRTNDGVFANPSRDIDGEVTLDESKLKKSLEDMKKIKVGNGYIYLGNNDTGFAEYGTFQTRLQDSETFAQGGLARIIEHTEEQATSLKSISSLSNYQGGVNVWGFELPQKPIKRILSLYSERDRKSVV